MKKLIISMLFAVMAMGASAQTTWNLRVMGGVGTNMTEEHGDPSVWPAVGLQFQSNISLKKGSRWSISPSLVVGHVNGEGGSVEIYVPVTIGYKLSLGPKKMFYPKAGIVAGVGSSNSGSSEGLELGDPIFGPTIALDFELSHFVIGLDAFYSVASSSMYVYGEHYDSSLGKWVNTSGEKNFNRSGVSLTLGYKF